MQSFFSIILILWDLIINLQLLNFPTDFPKNIIVSLRRMEGWNESDGCENDLRGEDLKWKKKKKKKERKEKHF